MITKHFLKTLVVFSAMIALGLIGIFALNYFEKNTDTEILDDVGFAK
jgi:hypothetical protein